LRLTLVYRNSPLYVSVFRQVIQQSEKKPLADEEAISVRNFTTPGMFFVSVGRIIEHGGSLGLMNGHGSGMIKFAFRSS